MAANALLEETGVRGKAKPRAVPLYLAFAATGVGVALPGALLPALLLRWHMGDEQGGRLFLMAWIGSSAGALLVRGPLRRMLVLGGLAVAVAALALGRCGGAGADGWMALYGLGLGMTMTAISLIRQQEAERVEREMVRLNLLWAFGACLCPSLTVRALTAGVIAPLLFGVGAVFAVFAAWAYSQREEQVAVAQPGSWSRVFRVVPAGLILMIMLITGIEASAGGWLATYAHRGGRTVPQTIAAPTCLWAGLLASRLCWSFGTGGRPTLVVRASLLLMAMASVTLIAASAGWVALLASFLLGVGIGPTYPLLLAWALRFDRGGAIFFLAGVGSACLPWLTGLVSAQRESLRLGLAVPMLGTMVMLGVALVSGLERWSGGNT